MLSLKCASTKVETNNRLKLRSCSMIESRKPVFVHSVDLFSSNKELSV